MNFSKKFKRKLFSFVLALTIIIIIFNQFNTFKQNKLLFTIFKTNSYNVENSNILQFQSKIVIINLVIKYFQ